MKRFCYDGVLEQWKVDLVLQRAERMRFRDDELDDVLQELVFTLAEVEYDPSNPSGADEKTVLVSVIDRQLCKLRRADSRREALEQEVAIPVDATYDNSNLERRLDIEAAIDTLDEPLREVCECLGQGMSRAAIARRLGFSWHTVDQMVAKICKRFAEDGFEEELGW